jgi:hypothetical protein
MVQLDKHCIFSIKATLHLLQNPGASLVILADLKALSFIFYNCELMGIFILTGCE